jgi:hypothetical protein
MAGTNASQTLTSAGVFTDTQTITIGNKVYTTQTALTNVDGNVLIGANAAATLQNLKDAINLTGTPGVQYALAMTKNTQAVAGAVTATTLVIYSNVPGSVGNLVPTTETQTNASFGAATMAGGAGDPRADLLSLLNANQVNANVYQQVIDYFDPAGTV